MPKPAKEQQYFGKRSEVPAQHQWKLEKMYKSIAEWEKHYKKAQTLIPPLAKFRGKLKTPAKILEYFQEVSGVVRQIEKLYVYASHGSAVDLSNHHLQILTQKAQNIFTEFSQTISFQGPELSKLPDAILKKMIANKKFHSYHRELRIIVAKKKHILSDAEEALMSQVSKITTGPDDIFSALDNVDLTFSDVPNDKGEMVKLTNGNYVTFLENPNRKIRQNVFETYYKSYQSHIHTFAQTLNLAVKQHEFYAKAKKYNSSLEASLSGNMIDPQVYQTLLKETHNSLPELYKYMSFRAKELGLKKINMWDMRVNLMNASPLKFTFAEAVKVCLEAVAPLGEEYVEILRQGLLGGWVDKFENKGKRGGAFSGGCYDSDPYILMNFTGSLNDVYTLIHESGHSMHSYFARKNQPYSLSDYSLFTAEIASTVNERLLTDYLLKKYSGDARKIVIAYEIDAIRATYFRQTMFAEFELNIHQKLEKGEPLTVQYFNEEYARLNTLYHGPSVGPDDYIQYEWARIPHFYYNFYVYQYATGIAAAYYFAEQILHTKTGHAAAEKYLNFLKSGGDHFPLEQMKRAGLDFTKPTLYRAVAKNLQRCLNMLSTSAASK
jgi:oligoendopeptidase F